MTDRTFIYLACTHHFNHLVSVTAGGPVFPGGTCSQVLRSTSVDSQRFESIKIQFSVLKFIEILILWIYYMTFILASASFGTFVTSLFNLLNYFVWLRITDEGSVTEMRIWSILLMKFDLKWCIHLDLFLYFNLFTHLVSVTAGGPESP